MASNQCNSTLDCLKVGSRIPRVCYEDVLFSERVLFCDCSNWYGWVGEECDKPTFMTSFSLAFLLLLNIWSAMLIFLSGRTLYFHFNKVIFDRRQKSLNPVFYTGMLVVLGSILVCIYTAINIPGLTNSKALTVFVYRELLGPDLEDVSVQGGRIAVYCFVCSGIVCALIAAQIVLTWYDVIEKTTNFFPHFFKLSPHKVKVFVKIWMLTLPPIIIILLSFTMLKAAAIVLFNAILIALILYLSGGVQFAKSLKQLNKNGSIFQGKALKIVITSVKINTVLIASEMLLILVEVVLYQILAQNLEPGLFNPLALVRYMNTTCALALLTFNSWYVHTITKNVLRLQESEGWLPSFNFLANNRFRRKVCEDSKRGSKLEEGEELKATLSNSSLPDL